MHRITLEQARRLALRSQGLDRDVPFGRGKEGALRAIEHLGYVQIDTISVIERAHHHVLRTRVPDYRPAMLDELLEKDRAVFEYWSHALSYLPMSDYRFALPRMRAIRDGKWKWHRTKPVEEMRHVLRRIRKEGGLGIRDFEEETLRGKDIWGARKPSKKGLEELFYEGRLMVSGRRGFQRLYDLAERVLPAHVDRALPSPREASAQLIRRVLRAHGFAQLTEICYLNGEHRAGAQAELRRMLRSGEIVELALEGHPEAEYFALAETIEALPALAARIEDPSVRILSPFDNLVIQRKRMKNIFGFDYTIECYVPEPKRKYGYFCLPLLWDERIVGRIDAKADRENRVLRVHDVWLEPGPQGSSTEFARALGASLRDFAEFNGCDRVQVARTRPAALRKKVAAHGHGIR